MTNPKQDEENKRKALVAWQRIHDRKPTASSAKGLASAKADHDQAKKQRQDFRARQAPPASQTLAKFPTGTSSASVAARPSKREENVDKARKEYQHKDLLATEARTKVSKLQLAAATLERCSDTRPQEITRLQTQAQDADRYAIALERESQAAKAKLTKGEEYLRVGQARAKALKDASATTIPSSTVPAVSEHGSTGIACTEVSQGERNHNEVEDLKDLVDEFDYAPSDDDGHKISPQEAVHEKASEPKAIEHQSLPTVNALENDLAIEESNSKDADDDFDGGLNDQDMDDAFDAFDASTALE